jgi:hypothetical protein
MQYSLPAWEASVIVVHNAWKATRPISFSGRATVVSAGCAFRRLPNALCIAVQKGPRIPPSELRRQHPETNPERFAPRETMIF